MKSKRFILKLTFFGIKDSVVKLLARPKQEMTTVNNARNSSNGFEKGMERSNVLTNTPSTTY